uniref:Uncharacterized protein n=1 Tax=Arundo donax TaxID=35708 RepID=A0A0A8ZLG8_ARUDO
MCIYLDAVSLMSACISSWYRGQKLYFI